MAAVGAVALPTRSQINDWPTGHLESGATQCEQFAERTAQVFAAHVANVQAPGGTVWNGAAFDAAYDAAREAQDVARSQGVMSLDIAQIARRGAEDIRGAQRATLNAISDAEDKGFVVAQDLSVKDARSNGSGEVRAQRQIEAAGHADFIRWRAADLVQTEARVAQELAAKAGELEGRRIAKGVARAVDFKQDLTKPDDLPVYGPDGKPHPGDVLQRDVGDCYFEAAEIAVAEKDPNRLKDMIVAGPDGKYFVSGMQDRYGNPIQNYVITQKDLQEVLSHHRDQKVLWPAILEAAAAKTRGGGDVAHGLEMMGAGDLPGAGLQQLTGHASYNWFPGGGRDENDLINALNSGKPVVMGTSMSATPIGLDPHRDGLAAAHVYARSSAHRDPDGTVWAEVINPWQLNLAQGDSGGPVVRIDPSTPGRAWINLSNVLAQRGVTAFVDGG